MAKFDKSSSEVLIDTLHHKVHHEMLFGSADQGLNVQAATPKLWSVVTPNANIVLHFFYNAISDGAVKVELYEGPTVTGAGNAVTPFNYNRNSVKTPTGLVYKDTTVSANGTLLETDFIGSSGGAVRGAGYSANSYEYNLKKNTTYLFIFTVASNGTNVALNCVWYEFDPIAVGA